MVSNFDLNRTALNNQMMGLSTDTKPTTGILPNSLFWELDTNGMYYFDGTQWQSIGGSGGGGGSNLSTANVTFVNNTQYPFVVELPIISGDYLYGYTTEEWITGDKTVVLYNNSCEGRIHPETNVTLNITTTGDIEVDSTAVIITGDGTITIS